MNRTMSQQQVSGGLEILIDVLKGWEGFPAPTAPVLGAWGQSAMKRQQLMIPLGDSAQGQWLKVQARALEDLARLVQDKPETEYYTTPPRLCPGCARRLGEWDCRICGYHCLNLERYIHETLASMHPAQHLPFNVLLLPDPLRKRLIFIDLSQPGHVLWEVPLDEVCRYPAYAQYLPEQRLLVADSKGNQLLICDLLGHVCQRFDGAELGIREPVMATALLAADGERRYLVVDRAGSQVLIISEQGKLSWRCEQTLSQPSFAALTPDQNILIADTGHSRVLELTLAHGHLVGCYAQELAAPVWVTRLESKQLLVADQGNARLHWFRSGGQHIESAPLNVNSLFRPLQIYLRRNGQLVIGQSGQAWEIRPGATHLSGYWEFENLICQELPTMVARPTRRAAMRAAAPRPAASLAEALRQTELFAKARPDVLELARKLCRCIRLKAGQSVRLEERPGLVYIHRGQVELVARGEDRTRVCASGTLLGESGPDLSGRELRALVPTKLYVLTHFSLETMQQFTARKSKPQCQAKPGSEACKNPYQAHKQAQAPKPAREAGKLGEALGERVKKLLSRPVQPRQPISGQGVKFNLFYTRAEREILLSAEDYRYRSYEVHIQFLPQGKQLEQLVALFQLIKSHGYLVKHRWFDGGRLLVAHVILNGVDTAPLKRSLQKLEHLDRYWVEPVVFMAGPEGQKLPLVRSAGA